jgi:hypothetical protein
MKARTVSAQRPGVAPSGQRNSLAIWRRKRDEGTAWLVFDAGTDLFKYQCFWFAGPGGDQLVGQARARTDGRAVAWGLERTPQVRIRLPSHQTYWAGTARCPVTLAGRWSTDVGASPSASAGHPSTGAPALSQRSPIAA